MRMGYELALEQTQKLVMTPELRQAFTILQLATLDLAQYLQEEVLANPVLEVKEEGEAAAQESETPAEEGFDVDWQEYFSDGTDLGYQQPRKERQEYSYEGFVSRAPTLREQLEMQLCLATDEGETRRIGEFIIDCIDDNGYLTTSLTEVAQACHTPLNKALQVLQLIQTFDPAGVGSRDLKECLLIQLRQLDRSYPLAEAVVEGFLEDLAMGRHAMIARQLNVDLKELQAAADLIRCLEPKPGRKYPGGSDVRYIVPDVVLEYVDGEYVVLVNDSYLPRLGINSSYRALLTNRAPGDQEARKFVESRLNAASWVIKSVEQRRLTLYRVVNCIVEYQKDFLQEGIKALKPLNLRQVAERLGVHESTVSRATANKYIQTPQGVFEIKFFFASGLASDSGRTISQASIKKSIEEFLSREDPQSPWTDQQITDHLKSRGLRISRRTVAKYRDEMGVPSMARRRRYS